MTNQNIIVNDIEGLLPAIDRRRLAKHHAVDGRNILFDTDGPYSAFGSVLVSYNQFPYPQQVESKRVGDESFLFSSVGIFAYDPVSQLFYPVYVFAIPVTEPYPWSQAYVGGRYYFAHRGMDFILEFNPDTRVWSAITTGVPGNPVSCCVSNGRLVVLGDVLAWSALDDGSDLLPDLTTGAGNQALLISGNPIAVMPVAGGFVAYTDQGIMRSDYSQGVSPFRHYPLATNVSPINPYAIVAVNDYMHIILDKNGLFQCTGKLPEPFQPIFSEYLTRTLLRRYKDLSIIGMFRLYYNHDTQLFALSIATPAQPFIYGRAYCMYLPSNKMGIFNRDHCAFGEFDISSGPNQGFNFGYVDPDGNIWSFQEVNYNQVVPDLDAEGLYFYHSTLEIPARVQGTTTIFSSLITVTDRNEALFISTGTGLYLNSDVNEFPNLQPDMADPTVDQPEWEDWNALTGSEDRLTSVLPNEDWNNGALYLLLGSTINIDDGLFIRTSVRYTPEYTGLDSYIEVGMFRFSAGELPDEYSMITNLSVSLAEGSLRQDTEDYMTEGGEEDWNVLTDFEDWGFEPTQEMSYGLELITSNDAIVPIHTDIPNLEDLAGSTKYYSCESTGVFHSIKLSANEPYDAFHLKLLEVSGTLAGRLL